MIPITSEMENQEGEIFTLNQTGRAIWDKFNGSRTLKDVIKDLISGLQVNQRILKGCLGMISEL
jgi:hypothetical protein